MKKARPGSAFLILILGVLVTISPFTIDMYLPAFEQIAKDFGSTSARISLSISSYFAGYAIGQLLYGPLLDRFGRKNPLYYGLGLYIIASIGCTQANTVEVLVAFRFIQALGGCVSGVASMAMVRDFFPVHQTAKIFSLLVLVIGLSPLLAPTLGGFVTITLGWQWVFVSLILIVLLVLVVVFLFLPEGHKPDPTVSLKIKPMLSVFALILKNPQFLTYILSGAFSFATLFLYVAGSPVIFMEVFNVSPQAYGGIFALLSVGFIGGNQLNILVLRKFTSEQIFRTGLFFQVINNIVFLVGVLNNWFNLTGTIIMFLISLSCLGFTYPNASALGLAPFSKNTGSASALIGFIQIGIAGLASGAVGWFNAANSVPIIAMMVVTALIAMVILIIGRKKITQKATIPGISQ